MQVSGVHGPSVLASAVVGRGLVHAAVTGLPVMCRRRTATLSHALLSQLWKVSSRGTRKGGREGGLGERGREGGELGREGREGGLEREGGREGTWRGSERRKAKL